MKYLLFSCLIPFNIIFPADVSFSNLAEELGHYPILQRSKSKSKIFKLQEKNHQLEACDICDQEYLGIDMDCDKKEEPQFHSIIHSSNHNAKKHLEHINNLLWKDSYQAYLELRKIIKYISHNSLDISDFDNQESFYEYLGNLRKCIIFCIKKLAHSGDEKAACFLKDNASIKLTKKEFKKFLNE